MNPMNDFLTVESLATFAGTTTAAIVISNTYRAIFKRDPRIIALIVSIGTCMFFAYKSSGELMGYFVALINGCLVFCSAYGLNNQIIQTTAPSEPANVMEETQKSQAARFFKKW
jgi:FtsH-binding integral membrane protein